MGHQRTPSSSDLQQFHHMTKQDAELRLESALNKLLHTAPPGSKDSFENEFTGFRRLFSRFVRARHGAQIEWDRIQDLPEGSIRGTSNVF
ncbi:unnamed protein product [Cyprideis torosa]|uniref:Uncharacterized protein n=1 Tax=Cyprideis torosa TaxID=163714 RepID=A0A7R8ZNB6_9CRUS|nr:unnamed protein product [Cyprideis torosa]CAG0891207.1 unnamed protein product [Cyprideis torosa]